MKIKPNTGKRDSKKVSGIQLIEGMVYMALYLAIVSLAFTAFFKLLTLQRDLQRNSEVLIACLHAGEQWREDVRLATVLPEFMEVNGEVRCRIPQEDGSVWYRFDGAHIWRQAGDNGREERVLSGVEVSEMGEERREMVTAMRWEFRMKTKKKVVRVVPEFSFYAVPMMAKGQGEGPGQGQGQGPEQGQGQGQALDKEVL